MLATTTTAKTMAHLTSLSARGIAPTLAMNCDVRRPVGLEYANLAVTCYFS